MIAKLLNGPQYCCCNNPPTYIGGDQTWFAVCLTCSRRFGPFRNATLAKKEWNKQMKLLWKEWQKKRDAK